MPAIEPAALRRAWSKAWGWLRLGLGLLLFALSLREIDWPHLQAQLALAQPAWLWAALLSTLAGAGIKILRWDVLLAGSGLSARPSLLRLGGAFLLGQAANILLPFRGGEVVRIGWLAAEDRQDTLLAAVSVFVEKYLDLAALLLLALWLGPTLPIEFIERSRRWLAPLCLALSALLAAALWLGPRLWGPLSRSLARRPNGRWVGLLRRADGWAANLRALRRARVILPALGLTVLAWLVMLSTNLLVLRALGLSADVRAGSLVLALVYFGVAPALMPGNLGPFYFFAMLGLAPFGISQAERGAFAVILHALVTLPPLVLAGAFLAGSRWVERVRG